MHKSLKAKKKVTFKEDQVEASPESSVQGGAKLETGEVKCESSSSSDEEAEDDRNQQGDLKDYILARDRVRRQIKPPSKYEDADLVAYALASAEDIEQ